MVFQCSLHAGEDKDSRREVNAEGGQGGNKPTVLEEKYIVLVVGGGPCRLRVEL